MYNFQYVSLVILITSMGNYFINVDIIEREFFKFLFRLLFASVYKQNCVIVHFYQFGQLDICLYFFYFLILLDYPGSYMYCLTPNLSHLFKELMSFYFFFLTLNYFLLCCVFFARYLVVVSRDCPLVAMPWFLIAAVSLVAEL